MIRRLAAGVVGVRATRVVSFLAFILHPDGEIWWRGKQGFLQTICGLLWRNETCWSWVKGMLYVVCLLQNKGSTIWHSVVFGAVVWDTWSYMHSFQSPACQMHKVNSKLMHKNACCVSHHQAYLFPGGQPLQELTAQLVTQDAGLAQAAL